MTKSIFEAFVLWIADSIDNNGKNLSQFKSEYQTILDEYNKLDHKPLSSLRMLGRFRIELTDLKNYLFDEKKVVVSTSIF